MENSTLLSACLRFMHISHGACAVVSDINLWRWELRSVDDKKLLINLYASQMLLWSIQVQVQCHTNNWILSVATRVVITSKSKLGLSFRHPFSMVQHHGLWWTNNSCYSWVWWWEITTVTWPEATVCSSLGWCKYLYKRFLSQIFYKMMDNWRFYASLPKHLLIRVNRNQTFVPSVDTDVCWNKIDLRKVEPCLWSCWWH